MTPGQIETLELIELLLSLVNKDQVYRHLRVEVKGREVFIEDTGVNVLLAVNGVGTIFDMYRYKGERTIHTFDEGRAAEWLPVIKQHYILDMLAGV